MTTVADTLRALADALEDRSRQFHRAEQDLTSSFVGMHGSWMGRVYTNWRECPTYPCHADVKLVDTVREQARSLVTGQEDTK